MGDGNLAWFLTEKWLWFIILSLFMILFGSWILLWIILLLPSPFGTFLLLAIIGAWGIVAGYKDWIIDKRKRGRKIN